MEEENNMDWEGIVSTLGLMFGIVLFVVFLIYVIVGGIEYNKNARELCESHGWTKDGTVCFSTNDDVYKTESKIRRVGSDAYLENVWESKHG